MSDVSDQTEDDNTNVDKNSGTDISDNSQTSTDGYLVIEEWGIKIKMRDADKITPSVYFPEAPIQFFGNNAYWDSQISYTINENALHNKECSDNANGAILRFVSTGGSTNYRIVGNYAYFSMPAPGAGQCGSNAEDLALQQRILEDFVPANIFAKN